MMNIKHSMITKSSVKYHYKRLAHAREGPKVYRERPEEVGGGPYFKKKVFDARPQKDSQKGGKDASIVTLKKKESDTSDISSPYNEYKRSNKL